MRKKLIDIIKDGDCFVSVSLDGIIGELIENYMIHITTERALLNDIDEQVLLAINDIQQGYDIEVRKILLIVSYVATEKDYGRIFDEEFVAKNEY